MTTVYVMTSRLNSEVHTKWAASKLILVSDALKLISMGHEGLEIRAIEYPGSTRKAMVAILNREVPADCISVVWRDPRIDL